MADDERDGVRLTSLDSAAGRRPRGDQGRPGRLPRRGRRPAGAAAGRPAAVGEAGAARARRRSCSATSRRARPTGCAPCAVWSEGSHREIAPGALRRPAHAAVAGQPACRGVPRPLLPRRGGPSRPGWCSTSTRPRARTSRVVVRVARLVRQALEDAGLAGAVKTSGSKGLHVVVPVAGLAVRGRRRRHPGAGRAHRAPRPRARHDGLHQGGPARPGLRRLDPLGPGHDRGRLQPADPARAAGVGAGRLGRAGRRAARGLHRDVGGRPFPDATGPRSCPSRSPCRPTWWRRGTPSRSPGCRRCTRASAARRPSGTPTSG